MTIKLLLDWADNKLRAKTTTPRLDAEILLSLVIKKPKEYFYTYPNKQISCQKINKFKNLIIQRSKAIPIAYLTNQKKFFGLNFYVNRNVLIPRPETELLVEETIKLAGSTATIADIGTGSGCIAVSLANNLKQAKILASDISPQALKVSKKNAKINRVKINFKIGSLLKPWVDEKLEIIVANLPYGNKKIWQDLTPREKKSLFFEPKIALYAPELGLGLYRQLFNQINKLKHRPKYLIAEIDPSQNQTIKNMAKKYFPLAEIIIKKDLAKLNRMVIISF
ncbi:MAG: peptide chain release factor N(5)-glutamine methyltransferase [Patescibacteria group bacterium]|jgi:release factor glutamine methyltransferase|nr:peptide chain release factor N(5)-glutamine methyltransferase [Patescibacteria group bacterium]